MTSSYSAGRPRYVNHAFADLIVAPPCHHVTNFESTERNNEDTIERRYANTTISNMISIGSRDVELESRDRRQLRSPQNKPFVTSPRINQRNHTSKLTRDIDDLIDDLTFEPHAVWRPKTSMIRGKALVPSMTSAFDRVPRRVDDDFKDESRDLLPVNGTALAPRPSGSRRQKSRVTSSVPRGMPPSKDDVRYRSMDEFPQQFPTDRQLITNSRITPRPRTGVEHYSIRLLSGYENNEHMFTVPGRLRQRNSEVTNSFRVSSAETHGAINDIRRHVANDRGAHLLLSGEANFDVDRQRSTPSSPCKLLMDIVRDSHLTAFRYKSPTTNETVRSPSRDTFSYDQASTSPPTSSSLSFHTSPMTSPVRCTSRTSIKLQYASQTPVLLLSPPVACNGETPSFKTASLAPPTTVNQSSFTTASDVSKRTSPRPKSGSSIHAAKSETYNANGSFKIAHTEISHPININKTSNESTSMFSQRSLSKLMSGSSPRSLAQSVSAAVTNGFNPEPVARQFSNFLTVHENDIVTNGCNDEFNAITEVLDSAIARLSTNVSVGPTTAGVDVRQAAPLYTYQQQKQQQHQKDSRGSESDDSLCSIDERVETITSCDRGVLGITKIPSGDSGLGVNKSYGNRSRENTHTQSRSDEGTTNRESLEDGRVMVQIDGKSGGDLGMADNKSHGNSSERSCFRHKKLSTDVLLVRCTRRIQMSKEDLSDRSDTDDSSSRDQSTLRLPRRSIIKRNRDRKQQCNILSSSSSSLTSTSSESRYDVSSQERNRSNYSSQRRRRNHNRLCDISPAVSVDVMELDWRTANT